MVEQRDVLVTSSTRSRADSCPEDADAFRTGGGHDRPRSQAPFHQARQLGKSQLIKGYSRRVLTSARRRLGSDNPPVFFIGFRT
jgi:hypothetical protein